MLTPQKFTTASIPTPANSQKNLEHADHLRKFVTLLGDSMSPWERAVTLEYAKAIINFELAKFAYDSLKTDYGELVKESHLIEHDGQNILLIRLGKERASILEKMSLNYDVDI